MVEALLRDPRLNFELAARYPKDAEASDARDAESSKSKRLRGRVSRLGVKRFRGIPMWDSGLISLVSRSTAQTFVLEGSVFNLSVWLSAVILRLRRRRVVFWGHGWKRPESGLKLFARKRFYALANGFLVYGSRAREFATSQGLNPERWHVVYNSLYPNDLLPKPLRRVEVSQDATDHGSSGSHWLRLIFSSRLSKRHGLLRFARSLTDVAESIGQEIHLTVIGDGEELASVRELSSEFPEMFDVRGPIYEWEELRNAYSLADFAVSPGASGLNVIQALGFGVPMIAEVNNPDSGPEMEAVVEGETGLLYQHGVDEELERVLRIATDMKPNDRATLGVAGYAAVRERYSSEAHADAIAQALLSLVDHEGHGRSQ